MAGLPLQVTVDGDDFDATSLRRVVPRPADDAEIVEIKLTPTDPAMIGSFAGKVVDEKGQPKAGRSCGWSCSIGGENPQQSFNWRLREGRDFGPAAGIVQFLSATSGADGSFRFHHVKLNNDIELAWWGGRISEGRKRQLERLSAADRTAIRIDSATPGAIAGKINRQTYPDLFDIGVIHQGVGGSVDVEFDKDPQKADYDFRNLTPGDYILTIRVDEPSVKNRRRVRILESQRVTVTAGKTTTLDLGFDTDPGPGRRRKPRSRRSRQPRPPLTDRGSRSTSRPTKKSCLAAAWSTIRENRSPDALVSLPVGFVVGQPEAAHPQHMRATAAGQFTFRFTPGWLASGETNWTSTATLWAYAPGHALAILPLDKALEKRPPRQIELVVGPATDTTFRVVDPDGKPVTGAELQPWNFQPGEKFCRAPEDVRAVLRSTSDAEGIARLPAIDRDNLMGMQISAAGLASNGQPA